MNCTSQSKVYYIYIYIYIYIYGVVYIYTTPSYTDDNTIVLHDTIYVHILPVQTFPLSVKPSLHKHLKEPMVLEQVDVIPLQP